MKPTHCLVALLVASTGVFATVPAHAGDEPETGELAPQVARLDSSAPPPVIAAAACSLQPILIVGGRARRFDVQVDGRRCSSTPAPDGAIPLSVRIERDPTQHVVVEASAPSDVSSELIRAAVLDARRELGSRLSPTPAPQTVAPQPELGNTAWTDARLEPKKRERFSPAMMGVGIATIVGGGVAMFAGAFGAMSSCGIFGGYCSNQSAANAWTAVMVAGIVTATAVGVPLLVIGNHKVTRVTASLSPAGGSLRLTF